MAIPTFWVPQCSSNSVQDRSSLLLIEGYPVGLHTTMLVKYHVGLCIDSPFRQLSQLFAGSNTC